jgi:F0F1-type ATP synthase membrane subunit b/b'
MLEFFLIINGVLIGACIVLAVQHALAHFRPHEHDAEHPQHVVSQQGGHLSPAVREQLLEDAKKDFERVLRLSAQELQQDLQTTAVDIKQQVQKLGTDAVAKELENYRAKIAELQQQTEATIGGMHQEITNHQEDLKAKMDEAIEAEKQHMMAQMDTKLADAVTSFLTETLQHDVDLGAQSAYLMKQLEEHKAELAKGVAE